MTRRELFVGLFFQPTKPPVPRGACPKCLTKVETKLNFSSWGYKVKMFQCPKCKNVEIESNV